MASERRIQERFSMDLEAKISYRFREDDPDDFIETVAVNISSGGAFLSTSSEIPLASKVKLEFLITLEELMALKFVLSEETLRHLAVKQAWVSATGVVIRQQPSGVAVIFDQNYQLTPVEPVKR